MLRGCARKFSAALGVAGLTRLPAYKCVNDADVRAFKTMIGTENVLTDPSALEEYNSDWFRRYKGQSKLCLLPKTTEQVEQIVHYCNEESIAVVPHGGNTNLVGSATPVFDEVVLSTKKMDKILHLDTVSGVLHCQAGCVLESLDNQLREHHLMMPIDLGAKGSCMIGGNVATNAGGIRYMRYGNLHGNTLGLRAVTPRYGLVDTMTYCKKDSTGCDLKQLFIGSEGLLGIVTEVSIQLAPLPRSVHTIFLGVASFDLVCKTFNFAKQELGEILSAMEFIDGKALAMVCQLSKLPSPLSSESQFYMLLETNGANSEHDEAKLNGFLEKAMEQSLVTDGAVAQSHQQSQGMWAIREGCALAPNALGFVHWYDICMPTRHMYELVEATREFLNSHGLAERTETIAFGHLGDGNLHLNVICKNGFDEKIVHDCDDFIYHWAHERKFSLSAEHGIGMAKRNHLHLAKPGNSLDIMKALKAHFDPKGILNPYKVFPSASAE